MTAAWRAAAAVSILVLAACSLTETTLADAGDVVVVELILRAGDPDPQRAFLYRTVGTGQAPTVQGARIEVSNSAGDVMSFAEVPTSECMTGDVMGPLAGTCYIERTDGVQVVPGASYSLRITLDDGRVITGTTTVPGDFDVTVPDAMICRLEPGRTIELEWTSSADTWVYLVEANLVGLADALARRGIELEEEPLRLLGLSVSGQDTTLLFPTGLGLFDRAEPGVADALLAIRDGLPADVRAGVTIAAADRNHVNWVRGGNFNPSGLVRVPSVRGAGTGVFGSIVPKTRVLTTVSASSAPSCDSSGGG